MAKKAAKKTEPVSSKKPKSAGPGPLVERQAENEAQEVLVGLLRAADDQGVQLVEEDWRKFSEQQQNVAVAWINGRRTGLRPVLPVFLRSFASDDLIAEADASLARTEDGRKALMPCIFKNPGYEKLEDGSLVIKIPLRIPDANLGDRSAKELFGKKHVRVEISRRAFGEWGQAEIVQKGDRRIVEFESDIMRYGWSDDHYLVGVRCPEEVFADGGSVPGLEEAIGWGGKQGSVRITVLGDIKGGEPPVSEPKSAPAGAKPKAKEKPAAAPKAVKNAKSLPGLEADEPESFEIGKTADACLVVNLRKASDGRWSADWKGYGFAGACQSAEPKFRTSRIEAVSAALGAATEHWSVWDDADAKVIQTAMKTWLGHLAAGNEPETVLELMTAGAKV